MFFLWRGFFEGRKKSFSLFSYKWVDRGVVVVVDDHSDGGRHRRREVVRVEAGLDGITANRFHFVRTDCVRTNVLELAQVGIEVLLRGWGPGGQGLGVVGRLDVMAEDGDDIAAEVLVVRTQSNTPRSGATANTTTTADILKVLESKHSIKCIKCIRKA